MKTRFPLSMRILPLALVLALAVACVKAPNDAQVTSDIQSRLNADSGLQNKRLTVQSDKGTVTLSGTVDNDAQRDAAAKYAASAPGVKQVINNLQVAPMTAMEAPQQDAAPQDVQPSAAPERTPMAAPKPSPSPRKHRSSSRSQEAPAPEPAPAAESYAPAPAAAPAPAPMAQDTPPPPPPAPQKVTVPSGTVLPVRLIDTVDSATAQTGDTFHATLDSPIAVDGDVVVPAHYDVEGHIVAAQASGKFAGRALLELQLDRIRVGNRWYNIETDHFKQETGSRGKNTATKVGAGAVAGAILGGIFGGGKGAAIGSVAGAGAGGGVQAASKKPDIKLSSERILTFSLQQPVTIVPTTKPARPGQKLEPTDQQ
jgi:outer membrane biosynthesis protein TonB